MDTPSGLAEVRRARFVALIFGFALLGMANPATRVVGVHGWPSVLTLVVIVGTSLAAAFLPQNVVRGIKPLPATVSPGAARTRSRALLRSLLVMRLAMAATPAMFGLVLSFVDKTVVGYWIAVPLSIGLLALACRPATFLPQVQARLEAGGGRSYLDT